MNSFCIHLNMLARSRMYILLVDDQYKKDVLHIISLHTRTSSGTGICTVLFLFLISLFNINININIIYRYIAYTYSYPNIHSLDHDILQRSMMITKKIKNMSYLFPEVVYTRFEKFTQTEIRLLEACI